jgi:poly-beta-1,6-N-acetyl-D-glucosamine synthase
MTLRTCVLIPAKDEHLGIAKTIKSVLNAEMLPSDIYVVDDGSSDGTGAIAASYGVNVLRNERNIGKAGSVARATREFKLIRRYDVIAMMDADTEVCPEYYREVRKAFVPRIAPWKLRLAKSAAGRFVLRGFGIDWSTERVIVVCGQAKSVPCNGITAYRAMAYCAGQFIFKDGQSKMGVITVAPGCAASYASDVFAKLDWSKDTIVEDMDVTVQAQRMDIGRIVYAPKAHVFTQDPRTIRDYAKQMYRWQTGNWQVGIKHRLMSLKAGKLGYEYKLLMIEGLLFSVLLSVSTIWYCLGFDPKALGYAFLANLFWIGAEAFACAVAERRWDILLHLPIYPFLGYLDCLIFVYSFWNTVVLRKQVRNWDAVKRY